MASAFGKDISCTTSLKAGRYVTGVRLVAEAAFRRLTTPRGMLRGGEEEASYGIDLTELVGLGASKAIEASLPGRIAAELGKDERIEKVSAEVVASTSGAETTYAITVRCETAGGPFTLQLSASDVTVELLDISEAA
jgi:hypothetical protein